MANNHKYTVTWCEFHRKYNGWSKVSDQRSECKLGKSDSVRSGS